MRKNLFLLTLCISLLTAVNAQMAPARSDAYQGAYEIRTGIGKNNTGGGTELPAYKRPTIDFRFFSGLKVAPDNPTTSSTQDHMNQMEIPGATAYPFFYSYSKVYPDIPYVYNWYTWAYKRPISGNVNFNAERSPQTAEAENLNGYKTYNHNYYPEKNFDINLSTDSLAPTNLFARINQKRDRIVLSVYSIFHLQYYMANPMTDLRITGITTDKSNNNQINYRAWFGSILFNPASPNDNEYRKIMLANGETAKTNLLNNGEGDDILNFNKNFDGYLGRAGNSISANTEAAVEMTGYRPMLYNNDIDAYGATESLVNLRFRMLSVGAGFFTTHTNDPYQISLKHFINIKVNRPAIAFNASDAQAGNNYLATPLVMVAGSSNTIPVTNLNITETTGALIPKTETSTQTPVSIDASRVRASLVPKAVYDAAVADGTINTNNDLAPISGFAYLTQAELNSNSATIPSGQYVIKYDYSSPDSDSLIKTAGSTLGNIFAKSIYRPLTVTPGLPVTFSSLTAKLKGGQLVIDWTTDGEKDNSHFVVEVSKDGKTFKELTTVQSKAVNGNSSIALNYSFSSSVKDVLALSFVPALLGLMLTGFSKRKRIAMSLGLFTVIALGYSCNKVHDSIESDANSKVFVRIKQVDKNGTVSYSKTVQAVNE